ncbi:hypothetical protein [Tessaracoccus flavus]|uniref:hypothetical protein n=1 Tax=Tessaracoccus flavus TaxID=1610493 RepID=UPI00115FF17A|nr:hypothetical protein [Tessaracoccus flavus]
MALDVHQLGIYSAADLRFLFNSAPDFRELLVVERFSSETAEKYRDRTPGSWRSHHRHHRRGSWAYQFSTFCRGTCQPVSVPPSHRGDDVSHEYANQSALKRVLNVCSEDRIHQEREPRRTGKPIAMVIQRHWDGPAVEMSTYVTTGGDSGSPWGVATATTMTAFGQHFGMICRGQNAWIDEAGVCRDGS